MGASKTLPFAAWNFCTACEATRQSFRRKRKVTGAPWTLKSTFKLGAVSPRRREEDHDTSTSSRQPPDEAPDNVTPRDNATARAMPASGIASPTVRCVPPTRR